MIITRKAREIAAHRKQVSCGPDGGRRKGLFLKAITVHQDPRETAYRLIWLVLAPHLSRAVRLLSILGKTGFSKVCHSLGIALQKVSILEAIINLKGKIFYHISKYFILV